MAPKAQRSKIAYKLSISFILISLLPLLLVGNNLVTISQDALRKEILGNQESLAAGFADNAGKYVTTFKNVLIETAGIEDFASMDARKQQAYLNRVMQVHMAIIELSVIDATGKEALRFGRFLGPNPELRSLAGDDLFTGALQRGEQLGRLERFQGLYPTINIAVAIADAKANKVGVLAAKISLNGLSQMLSMEFPQSGAATAAVVGPDGFLIAHSNYKEVFRPQARLSPEILKYISTQPNERGSGEIQLSEDARVLGSYADVHDLGWQVYVQQPLEGAFKASKEMRDKIKFFIMGLAVVVILLSVIVAYNITQPISILREAADKLGKVQFEDLPELNMPNDEIGDLAQTFLTMSESLKEAIGQRDHANRELEKYKQFLEKRVRARERELQAAQDELIKKERHAAIGKMASVVSHEIRNPLAVMKNSIYFIKMKLGQTDVDPKIAKHIKIIESEIDQANGIITEILDYARERAPKPERLAMNAFLEELISVYPFPPHIRIEKSFDPKDPIVNIDTTEMRQAVRNLIGNGIEVQPTSGAIKVTTASDAEWVMVAVTDAGSGIPPDILDKLFTEFFTTKARGTGLGLAVVKKVMDRHHGRVEVQSEVGKGTTFKLFMPLAGSPAAIQAPA
jgi:signal transduction histidine kinase